MCAYQHSLPSHAIMLSNETSAHTALLASRWMKIMWHSASCRSSQCPLGPCCAQAKQALRGSITTASTEPEMKSLRHLLQHWMCCPDEVRDFINAFVAASIDEVIMRSRENMKSVGIRDHQPSHKSADR